MRSQPGPGVHWRGRSGFGQAITRPVVGGDEGLRSGRWRVISNHCGAMIRRDGRSLIARVNDQPHRGEVLKPPDTTPEGFDIRLAIALPSEEPAKHARPGVFWRGGRRKGRAKMSILQRWVYQTTRWSASSIVFTGRVVNSSHCTGSVPAGASISWRRMVRIVTEASARRRGGWAVATRLARSAARPSLRVPDGCRRANRDTDDVQRLTRFCCLGRYRVSATATSCMVAARCARRISSASTWSLSKNPCTALG